MFFNDYEDMQLSQIIEGINQWTNAGEAETKGIELEVLARPIPPLTVNAAISYLDAEFEEFIATVALGAPGVDAAGKSLAYSPEWQGVILLPFSSETTDNESKVNLCKCPSSDFGIGACSLTCDPDFYLGG